MSITNRKILIKSLATIYWVIEIYNIFCLNFEFEHGFQVLVGHEDVPSCCCISEDAMVAVSGARDRLLMVNIFVDWKLIIGEYVQKAIKHIHQISFFQLSYMYALCRCGTCKRALRFGN